MRPILQNCEPNEVISLSTLSFTANLSQIRVSYLKPSDSDDESIVQNV